MSGPCAVGRQDPVPEITFGVNLRDVESRAGLTALVRRADELGFDAVAAPDHLGMLGPFTVLAAAAAVSSRLRLRTYVLNVGFWNAALLAREVATLDLLSDGRAEVGIGAGHFRHEYDDARLPWRALGERVEALERTVIELRRRLADVRHRPRPVQRPVPVLVGAMSPRGLSVAARRADVVGFAGLHHVIGAPAGTFTLSSSQQTRERVASVREQAGGRPYRSDALLQEVVLGRDPAASAAQMAAAEPDLTAEQLTDTPFVLLARDADHAADELIRRQVVYGFDSVTTHQPNLESLGAVIAAYRARVGT